MPHTAKKTPYHILPALWGLDVAFAAFCWALCGAEHMQIAMVSEGPVLLLVVGVWVYTIASRVHAAIRQGKGWYHYYYESRAVPMVLLAVCAAAAGVWMLCYYVGKHVLIYAAIPAFLHAFSIAFLRNATLKALVKALAFGFACMVPAFSMSYEHSAIHMVFCGPCWYIGILFFLYQQERVRWKEEGQTPHSYSRLLLAGLFGLLLVCAFSASSSPYFEHSMCLTIAMGAACLLLLAKIRPSLNEQNIFCLCWPVMTLPALLSILLFSPAA